MSKNIPKSKKKVSRFKYKDLKPDEYGFRKSGEDMVTIVDADGGVRKEKVSKAFGKIPIKRLKINPKTIMVDEEVVETPAEEAEVEAEEAAEEKAEETEA